MGFYRVGGTVSRKRAWPKRLVIGGLLTSVLMTGCTSSPDDADQPGGAPPTQVTVAWNAPLTSYNNQTAYGSSTTNSNILYLTQTGFNYYDDLADLVQNTDFGRYELLANDPTSVRFTINDGVEWSDGVAVDGADMLLAWAAQSATLNSVGYSPSYDDQNQIIPGQGDDVYFDGRNVTLEGTTADIGDDGRSLTISWKTAFADWKTSFWSGAGVAVPAHVVGMRALGIDDPEAAKDAVVDAITTNDRTALKKLADTWNTAFNFSSLPDDPSLYLSFGAYEIAEFKADQYLILDRNERYDWGPKPSVDEITIRFIADPLAAVQALKNGEVDIVQPQSDADVLRALEDIDGVQIDTFDEATFEHIDLNIGRSQNPGVWSDVRVREAFLKTIPRQEIVEKLFQPMNPSASVLNSHLLLSSFPGYDDMVAANGSAEYASVDIAGARALLADAGVSNPEVCLLYNSTIPRLVDEFELIKRSAARAGFNVTDCGEQDWGSKLSREGLYDAVLFAWQMSSTAVSDSAARYVSGGGNNFYGYENPTIDSLYESLNTAADSEHRLQTEIKIEQELWSDAFGLPIAQYPGIIAHRDRVANVSAAPLSPTVFWNFWEWQVSPSPSP